MAASLNVTATVLTDMKTLHNSEMVELVLVHFVSTEFDSVPESVGESRICYNTDWIGKLFAKFQPCTCHLVWC